MASNYEDVLGQLKSAGLLVDSIDIGRLRRCKVDGGDREKRGWYHLHEIRLPSGEDLIVGSYGVWRGADNHATKVELRKKELSAEQRDSLRKRLAEDKRRAEQARKADAARAAERATKAWKGCTEQGDCEYLHRKGVRGHGVRYSPQGAIVIPMQDVAGNIHGLQIIRGRNPGRAGKRLDKEFWPAGLVKKGHFHQIGMATGAAVLLVAEGYATAATLYEATGLPVAVAFDAGNLGPVAAALHKRHKTARILICADDDSFSAGNPGITCASAAAMEVGGAYVAPTFADTAARQAAFDTKGTKLTDFNDLHAAEGLHVVRAQVEARLLALGWRLQGHARASTPTGEGGCATGPVAMAPIESLDELLERYVLIYGQGGVVFDRKLHRMVALSDMRDACLTRELHRAWAEHPQRQIAKLENVGFDPTEKDKNITCNLWAGWPTKPKAGNCEKLIDLLAHMCGESSELFIFVLCWLAYPIQHPGAKMKTTLVVHGPQGTGKNMFFDTYLQIFGPNGRMVDQSAIEDKFNDWASRKLHVQCDEVVARSEAYHIKNKLKSFITGQWIRINPKNMAAYEERNHVNSVFLSNEAMPVVLEEDDRRHAVIWTPAKLDREFYAAVQAEIDNGGVAALHDFLLHVNLEGFSESTMPPMTAAKRELIELSMDSPSQFVLAFERGDVAGFPAKGQPALLMPALSSDLYDLYCAWCSRVGIRSLSQPRFANALMRKHGATTQRKRYTASVGTKGPAAVTYLPGGAEMPPGESETGWLGERTDVFRGALKDFKGTAFA